MVLVPVASFDTGLPVRQGNIVDKMDAPVIMGTSAIIGDYKLSWTVGGRIRIDHGNSIHFIRYMKSTLKSLMNYLETRRDGPCFGIYFNSHACDYVEGKRIRFVRDGNSVFMEYCEKDGLKPYATKKQFCMKIKKTGEFPLEVNKRYAINPDLSLEEYETIDHTNFFAHHDFPLMSVFYTR